MPFQKMRLTALALGTAFLAGLQPVLAQTPAAETTLDDVTLHDFAAKWMMQHGDLADVGRYAEQNRALVDTKDAGRVVLFGDSITFHWEPELLPDVPGVRYVNRGIPGQNSSQMLLRFEADVVALRPVAVVLLAGTNDLRSWLKNPVEAGPAQLERLSRNITAMADIADARGIWVVLCALPPIAESRGREKRDPATLVRANHWMHSFASARGYRFVNYYRVLADEKGYLQPGLTHDGLHPNREAYGLMALRLQEELISIKSAISDHE